MLITVILMIITVLWKIIFNTYYKVCNIQVLKYVCNYVIYSSMSKFGVF